MMSGSLISIFLHFDYCTPHSSFSIDRLLPFTYVIDFTYMYTHTHTTFFFTYATHRYILCIYCCILIKQHTNKTNFVGSFKVCRRKLRNKIQLLRSGWNIWEWHLQILDLEQETQTNKKIWRFRVTFQYFCPILNSLQFIVISLY